MQTGSNHQLISDLAVTYADSFPDTTFDRHSIAAAYIIGAEAALRRVQLILQASAGLPNAPTVDQTNRLLALINETERRDDTTASLTPLQQIVYDTVKNILATRQNVDPCLAHIDAIRKSINTSLIDTLRQLCSKGIFTVNLDINKKPMFSIKPQ